MSLIIDAIKDLFGITRGQVNTTAKCSWMPCAGKTTPAVAEIVLGWSGCGHRSEPIPSCHSCMAEVHSRMDPVNRPTSPCRKCAQRSPARPINVIDLDL